MSCMGGADECGVFQARMILPDSLAHPMLHILKCLLFVFTHRSGCRVVTCSIPPHGVLFVLLRAYVFIFAVCT